MASALPPVQHKRPSQRAIAFAVAVVSSKPEALTVREYVRLLRQHVALRRRENAISAVYRHLDTSSYWRSEYERVRDTLAASENETLALRMQVDQLKAKLDTAKTGAGAAKKSKKGDTDVIPYPRSPKRARKEASPVLAGLGPLELSEEFAFADDDDGLGQSLLSSLYQVHTCLRAGNRTEAAVLVYHLVRAAGLAAEAVQHAIRDLNTNAEGSQAHFESTLSAAGRASISLVIGFTKLTRTPEGSERQGQVTYALTQMFQTFSNGLHELSAFEISIADSTAASKTTTSKPKSKTKTPRLLNVKENPRLGKYTNFLSAIISSLDAKHETHKDLFEGIFFCVISLLGRHLYVLVFGLPRSDTIASEITAGFVADETSDDSSTSPAPQPQDSPALRQSKISAPYLIHLLNRCMSLAPAFLGTATLTKSDKLKQASSRPASVTKSSIAISAKEKLQHTLVNSIFGTEGVDEGSDLFLECLKMPVFDEGQRVPVPKVKEVEVVEWFKGEVWKVLGWEVLANEGVGGE